MSQLIDNLNIIESVKTDIKTALENKGVDMTGVSFPGYASKIGEITTSFVTVPLSVSENGTYTPGEGIDGYSQVVVDVPQSMTGFTEKEITEGIRLLNLSNSASYVASNIFAYNSYIETVYLPNCISIYSMAFDHCTHLQSVNLPLCLKIGRRTTNIRVDNNCFNACTSLKYVSLPSCIEIGASCFQDCENLISIDLPVCEWISPNAFAGCKRLEKVNLSVCSFLGNSAFNTCTSLSELYIYTSSVCSLEGTRTFSKNTCLIYVPSSLVDVYKSATNWSVFSSRIFPISE